MAIIINIIINSITMIIEGGSIQEAAIEIIVNIKEMIIGAAAATVMIDTSKGENFPINDNIEGNF